MRAAAAALLLLACGLAPGRAQQEVALPSAAQPPLCQRLHDPGPAFQAAYLCLGVSPWTLEPSLWTPLTIAVNCTGPKVRARRRRAPRRMRMRAPGQQGDAPPPPPHGAAASRGGPGMRSGVGGLRHTARRPAARRRPPAAPARSHLCVLPPNPARSMRSSPRRRGTACSRRRSPCAGAGSRTLRSPRAARSGCRPLRTCSSPSARVAPARCSASVSALRSGQAGQGG
jgi:hypothetical protein